MSRRPDRNRSLQREARALADAHGIKYTEALRIIKAARTAVGVDPQKDRKPE